MRKLTTIMAILVLVAGAFVSQAGAEHIQYQLGTWIGQTNEFNTHPAYVTHCPDTFEVDHVDKPYTANINGETVTMSEANFEVWRLDNLGTIWTSGPCQWRQPTLDGSDEFKRTSGAIHPGHACNVEGQVLGSCYPQVVPPPPDEEKELPPPPPPTTTVSVHDKLTKDTSLPAKLCWDNTLVNPDDDCPAEPEPEEETYFGYVCWNGYPVDSASDCPDVPTEEEDPIPLTNSDVECVIDYSHLGEHRGLETYDVRQYSGESHAQTCAAVGGVPA